jgi:single-strand selective monofunctional uracil DNA glycosylase
MALGDLDVIIGRITHPSPANPKANKGWEPLIRKELHQLGIKI